MKRIAFFISILTLVIGVLLLPGALAQIDGSGMDNPELNKKQMEDQAKDHLNFELTLGEHLFGDEKRIGKIQKITLEQFNEDPVLAQSNEETLNASTKDPILLAVVQSSCEKEMILRPYFYPYSSLGCGGPYINGTLKIHTEKRIITVLITSIGFQFGEKFQAPLTQNIFYSWGLAKVVDEMIAEVTQGRQHLSRELFIDLSGESVIELNKQVYWELRHGYESEQNIKGLSRELNRLSKKLGE